MGSRDLHTGYGTAMSLARTSIASAMRRRTWAQGRALFGHMVKADCTKSWFYGQNRLTTCSHDALIYKSVETNVLQDYNTIYCSSYWP